MEKPKKTNKRGTCGKGKPNTKRGLTDTEKQRVRKHLECIHRLWERLNAMNKWRPLP
jgi:hypothetical protein